MNQGYLSEIASALKSGEGDPEIIIAVHGFSNNLEAAITWYSEIYKYVRLNSFLGKRNSVFIGYRWPSERPFAPFPSSIRWALCALPTLPKGLLIAGTSLTLVLFICIHLFPFLATGLFGVAGLAQLMVGVLVALLAERLFVYFRDGFRANYFATPDLVDFIRALDGALDRATIPACRGRVKISFLAHSLGCSITTNALRVLSDVFDNPSAEIGKALSLSRLVLVAPDIPAESVIPRRSNVLVSALKRVGEVHVFTNEGDLALRLASTAANYFSFPARSRFSGYRLGNLTVRHFEHEHDHKGWRPSYGVVDYTAKNNPWPSNFLEIRASNLEHRNLWEKPFHPWVANNPGDVTNRISYYDCTDYVDWVDGHQRPRGMVSRAIRAQALNLPAYIRLLVAYLIGPLRGGVDTHGGYFKGSTSKHWIYTLAFAGFDELLNSLLRNKTASSPDLGSELDDVAKQHQLQVLLSCAHQHTYETRKQCLPPHPVPPYSKLVYVVRGSNLFLMIDGVSLPCKGDWTVEHQSGRAFLVLGGTVTSFVATDQDETEFREQE
jgi:hypothetical protein